MSEWIELNLPYSVYLDREDRIPYPDLSNKIKDHFGLTIEEFQQTLKTVNDPEDLDLITLGETWKKYEDITESVENDILDESPDLEGQPFYDEVKKRLLSLNNDSVNKVLAYRDFRNKVKQWEEEQPEIIKWYDLVDKLETEHQEKMKPLSFCGLGLNNPGTLIEVEHDNKIHEYLIGDINANRGVCDDCTAFENNAIVKRYMVIWSRKRRDTDPIVQRG